MSATCFPLVGGRVMRATRLDACGAIDYGECSKVTSEGFVSVATTTVMDEPDVIELRNANGKMCVRLRPSPRVAAFDVEITFCQVDPDLYAMLTGQTVVLDDDGNAVGFRVNSAVDPDASGWALEVWSNVPNEVCDPVLGQAYGYVLYPFLKGGTFGDYTIENDAVTFTITGAQTKVGSQWGVGPYDVVTAAGLPSPLLVPIATADHLHVQLTYEAPPEPDCGCAPLDDPAESASAGATAGTPGTFTPLGSNRPDDLAALQAGGVVASPATAWTTGQYVVLEDGSKAHWTSAAWAAGEA